MNVTANFGRLAGCAGVIALAALSACSPTQVSSINSTPEGGDVSHIAAYPEAGASLAEMQASAASSSVLLAGKGTSPEITLGSDAGHDRLSVAGTWNDGDYKVSRLSEPSRLVIDLYNTQLGSSQTISTSGATLISQVRVGSHPDKSRLVVDLKDNSTFSYDVKNTESGLTVTLATESSTQKADVSGANTESTQQSEQMALNKPILRGLSLETLGQNGNMLIADMNQLSAYELQQTAPSEYVLTLNSASIDASATGIIMSPVSEGTESRIRSVRPVMEGENVKLRIFASPDASLSASTEGNRIIVAASGIGTEVSDETIRAQMNEPAPVEGEVAKPVDGAEGKVEEAAAQAEPDLSALLADSPKYSGRLISLDLQDTDIDNALRIIAEVSNLNIIASDDVTGKVTLRLIDVPWDQALDVILKTNALDKVQEGNVIRIAPVEKLRLEREALKQAQQAEDDLEPLSVKYIRISYAKAADLKPLVEGVISERGTVSYDERTNQLIVKDIAKGLKNVAQLVKKLDLRTPQVLLETQIVEANRSLMRDLGSELGFRAVRAPEFGNATGYNFPNSVDIKGSAGTGDGTGNIGTSFPAAAGSGISFLLGSADGTMSLDARLSALEEESRIRVVSRPSVATTNNKPAQIKSVTKLRVKVPSGGLSVATGSGATAGGSSASATEVIEIGIVLDVTPQASPDYFVLLDLKAKSSTLGKENVVDGIPSEIERSANSTVLVASGQTFAMGGIYKVNDSDNVGGVPFFKDIPFLGHLFRRMKVDNFDEELIFFITPRIIEGSFDDAAMKAS